LLLFFAALLSCLWPLRLPRFLAALILVVFTWLGLSFYAAYGALFARPNPTDLRPSKWWLFAILVLAYLGFNLVFTPVFLASGLRGLKFASTAMERTLFIGDKFVIDKNYYGHRPASRGDLVVLRRNDYGTVKRVVAIGGDTVEGKNRQILINGRVIREPYVQHSLSTAAMPEMDTFGPVLIPPGKYFVLGDNRDVSLDSRTLDFGLLDAPAIVGKPLYIYGSKMQERVGKTLN
jgi:signal peptidase I